MKNFIEIARTTIQSEARALDALSTSIDGSFNQAIDLILNTKGRIIVSGIGKSGIVARKIAATLASTGTHAFFVHPVEASHGDLGMVHHDDAIILLSNGGESLELFDIVAFAQEKSIPIIAMVGRANSSLSKAATISLVLPAIKEVSDINAPTTSTTMMMALGDALAISLIDYRKFDSDDYKILHPGGRLGAQMRKVKDLMCSGNRLPIVTTEQSMSEVIVEMTRKALGCAVVVSSDDKKKILGLVTDGDLRRHVKQNFLNMSVDQVMTTTPYLIDEEMRVIEALEIMNKRAITSLVVASNNQLVGIIHIHDCLREGLNVMHEDDRDTDGER